MVCCIFRLLFSVNYLWTHAPRNLIVSEKLQTVINKHHHPITVIPNDLEHSIALYNQNLGLEYLTGYVVEYALSVR